MPGVARVNDSISHGGSITDGSPTYLVNSRRAARLGDPVTCAIHGSQTITSASTNVKAQDRGIARLGDSISCGAVITSASTNVSVN